MADRQEEFAYCVSEILLFEQLYMQVSKLIVLKRLIFVFIYTDRNFC